MLISYYIAWLFGLVLLIIGAWLAFRKYRKGSECAARIDMGRIQLCNVLKNNDLELSSICIPIRTIRLMRSVAGRKKRLTDTSFLILWFRFLFPASVLGAGRNRMLCPEGVLGTVGEMVSACDLIKTERTGSVLSLIWLERSRRNKGYGVLKRLGL